MKKYSPISLHVALLLLGGTRAQSDWIDGRTCTGDIQQDFGQRFSSRICMNDCLNMSGFAGGGYRCCQYNQDTKNCSIFDGVKAKEDKLNSALVVKVGEVYANQLELEKKDTQPEIDVNMQFIIDAQKAAAAEEAKKKKAEEEKQKSRLDEKKQIEERIRKEQLLKLRYYKQIIFDKEFLAQHNKIRMDPKSFIPDLEVILKDFEHSANPLVRMIKVGGRAVNLKTVEGDTPVKELIAFLRK